MLLFSREAIVNSWGEISMLCCAIWIRVICTIFYFIEILGAYPFLEVAKIYTFDIYVSF